MVSCSYGGITKLKYQDIIVPVNVRCKRWSCPPCAKKNQYAMTERIIEQTTKESLATVMRTGSTALELYLTTLTWHKGENSFPNAQCVATVLAELCKRWKRNKRHPDLEYLKVIEEKPLIDKRTQIIKTREDGSEIRSPHAHCLWITNSNEKDTCKAKGSFYQHREALRRASIPYVRGFEAKGYWYNNKKCDCYEHELSRLWKKVNADHAKKCHCMDPKKPSYITDFGKVRTKGGVSGYLAKYFGKSFTQREWLNEIGFKRLWSTSKNWPKADKAIYNPSVKIIMDGKHSDVRTGELVPKGYTLTPRYRRDVTEITGWKGSDALDWALKYGEPLPENGTNRYWQYHKRSHWHGVQFTSRKSKKARLIDEGVTARWHEEQRVKHPNKELVDWCFTMKKGDIITSNQKMDTDKLLRSIINESNAKNDRQKDGISR